MESNRTDPVSDRWMLFDVKYSRVGGWSIECECGDFETGYDSYDTGMFHELKEHFRDHHPSQDADVLMLSPFAMRAFVDYFDHQVETATSAKRWIVAIAVALGIGLMPILWRAVDWIVHLGS